MNSAFGNDSLSALTGGKPKPRVRPHAAQPLRKQGCSAAAVQDRCFSGALAGRARANCVCPAAPTVCDQR